VQNITRSASVEARDIKHSTPSEVGSVREMNFEARPRT